MANIIETFRIVLGIVVMVIYSLFVFFIETSGMLHMAEINWVILFSLVLFYFIFYVLVPLSFNPVFGVVNTTFAWYIVFALFRSDQQYIVLLIAVDKVRELSMKLYSVQLLAPFMPFPGSWLRKWKYWLFIIEASKKGRFANDSKSCHVLLTYSHGLES